MQSNASSQLPVCDWVYFATPARASMTLTDDFVTAAQAIVRTVYNKDGLLIANVSHVRPGDRILLVYGGSGRPYMPVYSCVVATPTDAISVPRAPYRVFKYLNAFAEQLHAAGYTPDPILNRFTGIAVTEIENLRRLRTVIPRPTGNNTLRRWVEVCPAERNNYAHPVVASRPGA